MKIVQNEMFQPITFTIETRDEALALWDIVETYANTKVIMEGTELAREMCRWFSEGAHL